MDRAHDRRSWARSTLIYTDSDTPSPSCLTRARVRTRPSRAAYDKLDLSSRDKLMCADDSLSLIAALVIKLAMRSVRGLTASTWNANKKLGDRPRARFSKFSSRFAC